uniref:Fucolectin tachylectin-4 pentraxin-1 domain-containing protein n=1 Tax=Esox lucius TaxID=8010 RepID=A0A3P9A5I6_ESOLU
MMRSVMMFHLITLLGQATSCPVDPPNNNLALHGKATQSNQAENLYGHASNAIDGNRQSDFFHGSCTHSEKEANPWWRVDLLKNYQIHSVVITNRGDCCSDRLNGAEIRIGDSLNNNGINNPRCAVIHSIPVGGTSSFSCNGMKGRYVTVVIPGFNKILTLCEVEVYGSCQ